MAKSWDEKMENAKKEKWFEMGRLQTLRNVTRLMEYDFKLQRAEQTEEDTGMWAATQGRR